MAAALNSNVPPGQQNNQNPQGDQTQHGRQFNNIQGKETNKSVPNVYEEGKTAAIIFGSLTTIISIIYLIIDIVRMSLFGTTLYGPGLWFGALFIATGVLGVFAGLKKLLSLIIAVLTLSVVSMVVLIVAAIILGIDAINADHGVRSTLFVLGALIFVTTLGSSISACAALCNCCHREVVYREQKVAYQTAVAENGQSFSATTAAGPGHDNQAYTSLQRPGVDLEGYLQPVPLHAVPTAVIDRPRISLPDHRLSENDEHTYEYITEEYSYVEERGVRAAVPPSFPPPQVPTGQNLANDGGYLVPYESTK